MFVLLKSRLGGFGVLCFFNHAWGPGACFVAFMPVGRGVFAFTPWGSVLFFNDASGLVFFSFELTPGGSSVFFFTSRLGPSGVSSKEKAPARGVNSINKKRSPKA